VCVETVGPTTILVPVILISVLLIVILVVIFIVVCCRRRQMRQIPLRQQPYQPVNIQLLPQAGAAVVKFIHCVPENVTFFYFCNNSVKN